jgi:hypothetical protein
MILPKQKHQQNNLSVKEVKINFQTGEEGKKPFSSVTL